MPGYCFQNCRDNRGFALVMVMVAAALLGILAITFLQKVSLRAKVSNIAELISYRDYVLRYYSDLVANRAAWECTKAHNPTLPGYLSTGLGASAGLPLNVFGVGNCVGDAALLTPNMRPEIPMVPYTTLDGTSVSFTDLWTPLVLPRPPYPSTFAGRRLNSGSQGDRLQERNSDPNFIISAVWDDGSVIAGAGTNSVKITLTMTYIGHLLDPKDNTSFDLEEKEAVIFMNRTPAKNCSDALAAGRGKYDDYREGTSFRGNKRRPTSYFGDQAVASVDAATRLITCSDAPLIIPPCYENDPADTTDYRGSSPIAGKDNLCASLHSLPAYKRWQRTGVCGGDYGNHAIADFDENTGYSKCSNPYVLVMRPARVASLNYCGNNFSGWPSGYDWEAIAIKGVTGDGDVECSLENAQIRGGRGVQVPIDCGTTGVTFFNYDGTAVCALKRGMYGLVAQNTYVKGRIVGGLVEYAEGANYNPGGRPAKPSKTYNVSRLKPCESGPTYNPSQGYACFKKSEYDKYKDKGFDDVKTVP